MNPKQTGSTPLPTYQQFIDQYKSGDLLTSIFDGFGRDDEGDACIAQLANLHNTGQIDVLSLIEQPSFQNIKGAGFFVGQHVFCKLIPKLNDNIGKVMKTVRALVEKGGRDGAAGEPNAAFREWCSILPERSRLVIEGAVNKDPASLDCLPFALEAHNLVDEAVNFAENDTGERQKAGVVSLGRMQLRNVRHVEQAIGALRSVAKSSADDILKAYIMMSAMNIVDKNDDAKIIDLFDLLTHLCTIPGDHLHYSCASVLFFHRNILDKPTVTLLFQALLTLNPAHKGTIKELDNGLHAILNTEYHQLAIQFVEQLILDHRENLSLSEFERFSRELINGLQERFSQVFVSWLLSGEQPLCEGLSLVLRDSEVAKNPVNLSFADFELTSDQFVFLCHKVIGYFFVQSVFVGSVITSILRVCDEEAYARIGQLLYNPMLINFGGSLSKFLETIEKNDKSYKAVKAALADARKYLDGLKSVGRIKEFEPSEREKLMERQRFSDQMRDAYKEAEKKSVFFNLVSRSVLLYGRGSVTYIKGDDGERRAIETEMKSFSTSMELPRQGIVDPVGLDWMLRIYRVERIRL